MAELAAGVKPWRRGSFRRIAKLQDAVRNHGHVYAMQCRSRPGAVVAVKGMPNEWMCSGPEAFEERHRGEPEKPWVDAGIVRELNRLRYPYACDLLGIFSNGARTFVVTSLASQGDLFTWSANAPCVGSEREALMRPIAAQVCVAVHWLHELGVAHRDLSLENVLLTHSTKPGVEVPRVKLVDFSMAQPSHIGAGAYFGKPSYRAPEVHLQPEYDAFASDAFALGVVLHGMAARAMPWPSTSPTGPFAEACKLGMAAFLQRRLARCFTPGLLAVLAGLLEPEPGLRMGLGEACFARAPEGQRGSVWALPWWGEAGCSCAP